MRLEIMLRFTLHRIKRQTQTKRFSFFQVYFGLNYFFYHTINNIQQTTFANIMQNSDVRLKLSTMSFEELLKLKEKVGIKLLNKSVMGNDKSNSRYHFKRANKNRPREMSSKLRTYKLNNDVIKPKTKSESRDPRFDPLCGTIDKQIFKENYKFIFDLKSKEKKQLQQEILQEEDPKRIIKIKSLIQRLDNQIKENEKKNKDKSKQKDENGSRVKYKKKSDKKIEDTLEKYAELKKCNNLEKYLKRKSKKKSLKQDNSL